MTLGEKRTLLMWLGEEIACRTRALRRVPVSNDKKLLRAAASLTEAEKLERELKRLLRKL